MKTKTERNEDVEEEVIIKQREKKKVNYIQKTRKKERGCMEYDNKQTKAQREEGKKGNRTEKEKEGIKPNKK